MSGLVITLILNVVLPGAVAALAWRIKKLPGKRQ
jgi:hypothetical protein